MSVTLLGALLLAVSLVSVTVYMGALGQLLAGPRHPGLVRTAVCRLVAELLYVGVGLTILVTSRDGPLIGLGVFTLVRFIWQANAIADVRLTRRERRANMTSPPLDPSGRSEFLEPVANHSPLLSAAVVSAEIDRLSTKLNRMSKQVTEQQKALTDEKKSRRFWRAGLALSLLLGACGLAFGLVVFSRADRAEVLSQQNAQIITQIRETQLRLEVSVHEACTLDSLLIASYSPRAKAASPLGPELYDSEFRRLVASADRQQCHIPAPPGLPS